MTYNNKLNVKFMYMYVVGQAEKYNVYWYNSASYNYQILYIMVHDGLGQTGFSGGPQMVIEDYINFLYTQYNYTIHSQYSRVWKAYTDIGMDPTIG